MPLLELCLEQYGNRSWKDKKIRLFFVLFIKICHFNSEYENQLKRTNNVLVVC